MLTRYVATPLYRGAPAPGGPTEDALQARRGLLIAELRELEADRASGLLDESAYADARASVEAEAVRVFRQLG